MKASSSLALTRRLLPFARPYLKYVWILFAALVLEAPLTLVMPLILKQVVDSAVGMSAQEGILRWAIVLGSLTLASALLQLFIGYLSMMFRVKTYRRLRLHLFMHLQRLSLSYFNQRETGFLMSRQVDDIRSLGGAMADTLGRAAIAMIKAVACVGLLFYVQWRLAVGGVVLAVLIFGVQYFISPELRRRSRSAQEAWTTLTEALHQSISGHHLVRATASEGREARRFAGHLHHSIRMDLRRDLFSLGTRSFFDLILALMPTVIILGGVLLISGGDFTIGGLFAFYIYLDLMFQAVRQITGLNPALQVAASSLERIYEVLDTEPEIITASPRPAAGEGAADGAAASRESEVAPERATELVAQPRHKPSRFAGEVRFEHVRFAYEPDRHVLDDIHFHAAACSRMALVGPSGAGKTTLVHLLPRFYDPSEGRILVDGQDIREIDLVRYRQQIGIVPQEIFLFDRTLRENIAYGRPGATLEDVRSAARAANALDFIEALDEGFETLVGERGVRLSGGQRQRIAIAREILRDPAILILDEATSSLDSTSERLIQEALDRLLVGRTSFVIAHRLSTILKADTILVVDHGRIVERGQHEELLAHGGLYTRLYHSQFEPYERELREVEGMVAR